MDTPNGPFLSYMDKDQADKLAQTLKDTREFLQEFYRSLDQSETFNRQARKYLINARAGTSVGSFNPEQHSLDENDTKSKEAPNE